MSAASPEVVTVDASPVKASPAVLTNVSIAVAPSPVRKRSHATGRSAAASSRDAAPAFEGSAAEQESAAKRRRAEEDKTTVFSLAMRLTERLNQSANEEQPAQAPAGKARCPICWQLFASEKVDAHAASCNGSKRLKSADLFIKAYEPLQTIVNYDSAVAFLGRLRTDMQKFGKKIAEPCVVFHWTAEANHAKIEDTNFYVPKRGQVAHGNVYGNGIYAAVGFHTSRGYAKEAEKAILCLANAGRVYDNDALGFKGSQQSGYDSACFWKKRGYVFFSVDQVLPCFLVSKDDYQRAQKRVESALPELMVALGSIVDPKHDSDNGVMTAAPSENSGHVQRLLGWLSSLIGLQ